MEVKASAMILKAFQTCALALFLAKFGQTKAHLQQLFNSSVLVAGLHPTSSSRGQCIDGSDAETTYAKLAIPNI